MTRAALITAAVLLLASLSAVTPALAEDFKGENDLLRKIDPEERLAYFGLRYSLNDHEKRHFLSQPTRTERDAWLERWWAMNDPTPATPENERRIEHELRVRIARDEFGMKKAPGWDKRGECLIRWGWPAVRSKFPANIGFYRMLPPGELWYYRRLDMMIMFHDFNLNGIYIFAIEPQVMSARESLDKMRAVAEYAKLMPAEATQFNQASDLMALQNFNPDNIDYVASPDLRAQLATRTFEDVVRQDQINESKNNFYMYMEEKPTIYSFEMDEDLLPLAFDVTSFSGGAGKIRAEINFEVPTRELRFERNDGILRADVELSVMVRDIDMKEVAAASEFTGATQEGGETFEGPAYIPGQIVVTLDPGYYRIGIEAHDLKSGRMGVYRTNVELPPMEGALALSDILFASNITPVEKTVRYQKGNLQIVPHPLHAYRIPYPLRFYFEIYGLDTDDEGFALYEVEYRVVPVTKKKTGFTLEDVPTAIESKFESSGFGPSQPQHLEIATGNLWEGSFRLIITVMDRRTRESVEKVANFSILE
jgi:GWxTD domain-containing protein